MNTTPKEKTMTRPEPCRVCGQPTTPADAEGPLCLRCAIRKAEPGIRLTRRLGGAVPWVWMIGLVA